MGRCSEAGEGLLLPPLSTCWAALAVGRLNRPPGQLSRVPCASLYFACVAQDCADLVFLSLTVTGLRKEEKLLSRIVLAYICASLLILITQLE